MTPVSIWGRSVTADVEDALTEAFPDDRSIPERLMGWSPRLLAVTWTDDAGQTFAKFDGWPSYVRRAWGIVRDHYDLTDGFAEPSGLGPFRVCNTWRLDPRR